MILEPCCHKRMMIGIQISLRQTIIGSLKQEFGRQDKLSTYSTPISDINLMPTLEILKIIMLMFMRIICSERRARLQL